VLNLGMGEGDYDRMIARHCSTLHCCDINEADVNFAQSLNADLPQIHYAVKDALDLDYPNNHFDFVLSIDVIEHVSDSRQLLREVARVLKPGGTALITFPSIRFPFTYDPLNALLRPLGKRLSFGAYGFGHFQLIDPRVFEHWTAELGFRIEEAAGLSGYLSGLSEMYWVGFAQRLFKSNARNLPAAHASRKSLRPTTDEPFLARLTDLVIALDNAVLRCTKASVGRGYVLTKPPEV
jgi:SAM-dependent methyltransferase